MFGILEENKSPQTLIVVLGLNKQIVLYSYSLLDCCNLKQWKSYET